MFANNPALEALIRVMAVRPDGMEYNSCFELGSWLVLTRVGAAVPLDNIAVLSLGTGLFPNSISFNRQTAQWGMVQVRPPGPRCRLRLTLMAVSVGALHHRPHLRLNARRH